jgi:hypothetical protein
MCNCSTAQIKKTLGADCAECNIWDKILGIFFIGTIYSYCIGETLNIVYCTECFEKCPNRRHSLAKTLLGHYRVLYTLILGTKNTQYSNSKNIFSNLFFIIQNSYNQQIHHRTVIKNSWTTTINHNSHKWIKRSKSVQHI